MRRAKKFLLLLGAVAVPLLLLKTQSVRDEINSHASHPLRTPVVCLAYMDHSIIKESVACVCMCVWMGISGGFFPSHSVFFHTCLSRRMHPNID